MGGMRRSSLFLAPAVTAVACLILSACTGGAPPRAVQIPAAASAAEPAGSAGHPAVFSFVQESFPGGGDTVPQRPQAGDLAIGSLIIPGGRRLATADPAGYGEHGSYKIAFVVPMGATVTVTIDPPARGHVVISNPYAPQGVAAVTYQPCAHVAGFYAQDFAFSGGQTRGCVPLDVRTGDQRQVRHVTLSLFAGSC
jgi:hypothetical protein